MKKLVVAVAVFELLLTGCTSENKSIESVNVENESIETTAFDLVADSTTRIIYIRNYTYAAHYIYTPYFSENGKLCKFVDNEIVEVSEEVE